MNMLTAKHGLRQFQNEVFESMTNQFMELWKRGHTASYNINCSNGEAWMNISSYLGYQESDNYRHSENTKSKSAKRSKGSPSKLRRSKIRLESFLEKKRLESSQQLQPQQPESVDATSASGIVTINIDGNSDETSEKISIKNNCLENPDDTQTQHVTAEDDIINEEPAATHFTAETPRTTSEDKDSQSQSQSNEADDETANEQTDERSPFPFTSALAAFPSILDEVLSSLLGPPQGGPRNSIGQKFYHGEEILGIQKNYRKLLLLMKRTKADSYSIPNYFMDSLNNFLDSSSYSSRVKEGNLSDNDEAFFYLMKSFIKLIYDLTQQKLLGKLSEENYCYVAKKVKEHVQEGLNSALTGIKKNKVILSREDSEQVSLLDNILGQYYHLCDDSDEDNLDADSSDAANLEEDDSDNPDEE